MINVNWADVVGGGVVLAIGTVVAYAWCKVAGKRIRVQEASDRRRFEAEMAQVELPTWNGETWHPAPPPSHPGYDWNEASLAYLSETGDPGWAKTGAFEAVPVPPSEVSGPLPVQPVEADYDPAADAEDFLVRMRRENAEFLANLGNA